MEDKRQNTIKNIMSTVLFSDDTDMLSRASGLRFKENRFACSLDINSISLEEAKQKQIIFERKCKEIMPELVVHIALTSTKNSQNTAQQKVLIDGATKVVLVASGKGGVGKSTIAALLAHKLKRDGKRVGVIDADIYGPSIPHLFAVNQKPELEGNKMLPIMRYGIAINSIGFLSHPQSSISWRGPMAVKALYQLLSLTKWPELDYLIIDSPPGTGDIHLSLLQNYQIDGVYMVTTPQTLSQSDVCRALNLYKKFDVPIKGVIENMSYLEMKGEDQQIQIFPGNAGSEIADKFGVKLLAKLPINYELANACDQGQDLAEYVELLDFMV